MAGIKVPPSTRVLIAQVDGIGRDVPLSAEKLSPILAFYSTPNLAASIEICVRLLHHGGAGHTASIHSRSEAAVKQYGLAVPAFRIAVNTSSVHGSIGYSTNLFPAMTLGCGSPGGNITSDNIGPQHLMNVKRVAWESRPVEHRTVPADQRLATMPIPVQKSAAAGGAESVPTVGAALRAARVSPTEITPPASRGPSVASSAQGGNSTPNPPPASTPMNSSEALTFSSDTQTNKTEAPHESKFKATLSPALAAAAAAAPVPDRQTIARIVEQVFTSHGIPRRAASASSSSPIFSSTPSFAPSAKGGDIANLGGRSFSSDNRPEKKEGALAPEVLVPAPNLAPLIHPLPPPIEVAEFLSENDVRQALTRNRKLYIGPKTILTPSARDLGGEHDVFIVTDVVPAPRKRRSES
jgi:hypothetical protein